MQDQPSPVELYQRATRRALAVATAVRPEQLELPTPCDAWNVQDLLLATPTGQPSDLEPELVDACVAVFLPDMPASGRAAGIVGPATALPDDATTQHRLVAAMGRTP